MRVPGDHLWRSPTIETRTAREASLPGLYRRRKAQLPLARGARAAIYLLTACLALLIVAAGAYLATRAVASLKHRFTGGPSAAATRAAAGTLLYTVGTDERAGIMRLAGGKTATVTDASERREGAVAAPDGSQIIYLHAACPRCSAAYELHDVASGQMRVIGTAPATPGGTKMEVAWAGDSQRIAFTEAGLDARRSQIFLLDEHDGSRRPLSPSDPEAQRSPVWSPDGRTVAYLSGGERTIVSAVDTATGEFRPLNDQVDQASDLSWSPDGRYLAVRHADGIWLIDPVDGHGFQVKAPGPVREIGGWAPGSRSLVAIVADRALTSPAAPASVYVIPVDGGAPVKLASAMGVANPIWSPDGGSVAWVTAQADGWTVSRTSSVGGAIHEIARGTGRVTLNSWR